MTPFQIVALVVLGGLVVREVIGSWRDPVVRPMRWLRAFVWLCASVAIWQPDLVQEIAQLVGIGRGADLVFYLFVLAFLGVSFHFYARFVRMQRQITLLVRQGAMEHARQGGLTVLTGTENVIASIDQFRRK